MRGTLLALIALTLCVAGSVAQDRDPAAIEAEPIEAQRLIAETKAVCAAAPDSPACWLGQLRTVQIVSRAVAEAGNTGDRAQFIDLVRALLTDGDPEIRASALYALAKLGPDASDTPLLRRLALDPIELVRGGAWSAANRSSDPDAKAIALRPGLPVRGGRSEPDLAAFDPQVLSIPLPEGAQFFWFAGRKRAQGELSFISPDSVEALSAHFANATGAASRPISEATAENTPCIFRLEPFKDTSFFADTRVIALAQTSDPTGAPGPCGIAVYREAAFAVSGFAIVWQDERDLRAPRPDIGSWLPDAETVPIDSLLDPALLEAAGAKPGADPEDTSYFFTVRGSGGIGAADYLELFPEGAYAEEARALLAAPQLETDKLVYSEGEPIRVRFLNLRAASSARVELAGLTTDNTSVQAVTDVSAAREAEAVLTPSGALSPGLYRVTATVTPDDGSGEVPLTLRLDVRVEAQLATLALDKASYAPGETITITFAGMAGHPRDYLSTADAGSGDSTYLTYVYTNSAREGTATLPAPSRPGAFELRAYFRDDDSLVRARVPFTVGGAIDAQTPSAPATPPPAGAAAPEARASVSLNKSVFAPGEEIVITFADMLGHARDYMSTAPAGSVPSRYLNYVYTQGATAGTVTLRAPSEPGAYEVRAFYKDETDIVRATVAFTVAAP